MSESMIFGSSKTSRSEVILSRILWIFIILLICFILGELIFHFIISPGTLIKHIIVHSDINLSNLSKNDVVQLAGLKDKEYYFSLKVEEIQGGLNKYPLIKNSVVERIFPDTLKITIYGRDPLVMALVNNEQNVSIPLVIDEQGVVFQIGSSITDWDLPVISGLKFNSIKVGMKIPDMLEPFLHDVKQLKTAYPDLYRIISEIRIVPKSGRNYELVFCPTTHPVKLRLGNSLNSNILKNAVMILDILKTKGLSDTIEELDFRTGEVVYRFKEG